MLFFKSNTHINTFYFYSPSSGWMLSSEKETCSVDDMNDESITVIKLSELPRGTYSAFIKLESKLSFVSDFYDVNT